MNRYEKLNNSTYIYKNCRLFYECASAKTFNSVLDNFTRNILNTILFNISVTDLKKLVECREKWEYLENLLNKQVFKNINVIKDLNKNINKDFQKIINKNVNEFLEDPCDTIEDIIY